MVAVTYLQKKHFCVLIGMIHQYVYLIQYNLTMNLT
jgi:hypothetical protein